MIKNNLLIVDDIPSIRESIGELLSRKYNVSIAENYNSAVEILKNESIDLVITDIRMPGRSGLELIHYIQAYHPDTLYALMTAFNINDYIRFAYEHGVWNIIPKHSLLDLNLIEVIVAKIISSDIFGAEKYCKGNLKINEEDKDTPFEIPPLNTLIFKTVKSDKDRTVLCRKIARYLMDRGAPNEVQQVLEELTSNALIRAPRHNDGKAKYQDENLGSDMLIPHENIKLDESDYFDVGYGSYLDSFIIVVRDYFGSLRKEEILKRFDRHTSTNSETGLPEGLSDSHGRGLYICREISDQLIFNIRKEEKTEVILFLGDNSRNSYKSISIFEK